jgi:hypothetical protein
MAKTVCTRLILSPISVHARRNHPMYQGRTSTSADGLFNWLFSFAYAVSYFRACASEPSHAPSTSADGLPIGLQLAPGGTKPHARVVVILGAKGAVDIAGVPHQGVLALPAFHAQPAPHLRGCGASGAGCPGRRVRNLPRSDAGAAAASKRPYPGWPRQPIPILRVGNGFQGYFAVLQEFSYSQVAMFLVSGFPRQPTPLALHPKELGVDGCGCASHLKRPSHKNAQHRSFDAAPCKYEPFVSFPKRVCRHPMYIVPCRFAFRVLWSPLGSPFRCQDPFLARDVGFRPRDSCIQSSGLAQVPTIGCKNGSESLGRNPTILARHQVRLCKKPRAQCFVVDCGPGCEAASMRAHVPPGLLERVARAERRRQLHVPHLPSAAVPGRRRRHGGGGADS